MPRLILETGPKKGQEYIFTEKDRVVIGRSRKNFIPLDDVLTSRRHAIIYHKEGKWVVEDLNSRNGILVNASKKKKVHIVVGDTIQIGHTCMKFQSSPRGSLSGRDIAGYKLLEKIGQGGMGEVYKAHQSSLNRVVAIKILMSKKKNNDKAIKGFIDEARKAGSLNHPNIIQVHDVGQTPDGLVYFSMEFIEGVTLKKWLNEFAQTTAPLPTYTLCEVFAKTADALHYAHVMGLVHRDVKPDNIMITAAEGDVKIADLGIALKVEKESDAKEKGSSLIGTPHYMAPEQILQRPSDGRLDIYALGATAYHIFSGYTVFNGKTSKEIIKAHIRVPPTSVTELNPEIPDSIGQIIMKMLEKNPSNRYQQAKEVADAFREAGENLKTKRGGGSKSSMFSWIKKT